MVSHPETGSDLPIGSDRDRGRDNCSKVNQSLGISIGHLSVHAIEFIRLCSNRSPLGPYNHHIRLKDVPSNKIHLVLDILNFLDLFD